MPAAFNARAEGIAVKSMFRGAVKKDRCIIPTSGSFEWTGPKEDRHPWFISAIDGEPLCFAGLWERWIDRETGEAIVSCTIITCAENEFMSRLHTRMPVILDGEGRKAWLDDPDLSLLKLAPEGVLQAWKVSKAMNGSRYEAPEAVTPIY